MSEKLPIRAPQTADKYVIRFPDGMRRAIAEAAKANNRSMNAEIVDRLERSLNPVASTEVAQQNATIVALANLVAKQEVMLSARQLDLADASDVFGQLLPFLQNLRIDSSPGPDLTKKIKNFIKHHAVSADQYQKLKTQHGIELKEYLLELALANGVGHLQPALVEAQAKGTTKKIRKG